jgi:hypothetical protein
MAPRICHRALAANAAEIKVLSSVALTSALDELAPGIRTQHWK